MIGQRIQDAWNALLDLIGQLIAPDWGWLVSILPLLIGLLVAVGFVYMLWIRTANAVWNVSRVPRPRRAPPPPPGLHLPGPSLWPFLLPLGAAFMIGALIFKPGRTAPPSVDPNTGAAIVAPPASPLDLVNVPLLVIGFVIVMVGIVGWYRDANRELRRVEAADAGHAHEPAAEQLTAGLETSAVVAAPAHDAPPGVHLPGPSPWPFFAPIALAFTLFGLLVSPALLVGGIVMCVIAIGGWYRDASREYTFVEAGEAPEPRTRDPERAFPKMLFGAFVLIGLASIAVAGLPLVLGGATAGPSPSASASGGGGGAPTTKVTITAVGLKFTPTEVTVAANQPITITLDNRDSVQHNIAIFAGADASAPLVFRGTVFAGPKTMDYTVPAMAPGSYYFHCDVHPETMTGTITAK